VRDTFIPHIQEECVAAPQGRGQSLAIWSVVGPSRILLTVAKLARLRSVRRRHGWSCHCADWLQHALSRIACYCRLLALVMNSTAARKPSPSELKLLRPDVVRFIGHVPMIVTCPDDLYDLEETFVMPSPLEGLGLFLLVTLRQEKLMPVGYWRPSNDGSR